MEKARKNIYDLWVWNFNQECKNYELNEFNLSSVEFSKEDLKKIEQNFKNITIKKMIFSCILKASINKMRICF